MTMLARCHLLFLFEAMTQCAREIFSKKRQSCAEAGNALRAGSTPIPHPQKEKHMSKSIPIKGTEHTALPGARAIGPTDPHQPIVVSVVLKHLQPLPALGDEGKSFTHADFAKTHGADPSHVEKIRQFAREYNLQMLERGDEVLRRTVTLAGTAGAMEKAFSVELTEFDHPDGTYRGHTGAIQMPEQYASFVFGIFGLDDRPVAHPHFRYRGARHVYDTRAANISYTPLEVAKYYGFPKDTDGNGQTIGIIALGGGYRSADIREYFQRLGNESADALP